MATHYVEAHKLEDLKTSLKERSNNDSIEAIVAEYSSACNLPGELGDSLEEIEHCFSAKNVSQVLDRVQIGTSDWAQKTSKSLLSLSPKSLLVTFHAIERNAAPGLTIGDALKLEYRMSQRFMRPQPKSDFVEGIRAVLVDKVSGMAMLMCKPPNEQLFSTGQCPDLGPTKHWFHISE